MGKKKEVPKAETVVQEYADFENSYEPQNIAPIPASPFNRQSSLMRRSGTSVSNLTNQQHQMGQYSRSSTNFGEEVDTQTMLLRTFENFYQQESETLINALEESRDDIKNSMLELCMEQEKYKEELMRISDGKYNFRRKKGNRSIFDIKMFE
jgi:hypothetical protein